MMEIFEVDRLFEIYRDGLGVRIAGSKNITVFTVKKVLHIL